MNSPSLKAWAGTQAPKLYKQGQGMALGAQSGLSGLGRTAGRLSGLGRTASGMSAGLMGAFGQMRPAYGKMMANAEISPEVYANQAAMDVAGSYDRARGMQGRQLGRMGVNPNSGRFAGETGNMSRAEAADVAGAKTRGRTTGRMENFARLGQVGQMGLGLASQARGALGQAGNLEQAAGMMRGSQTQGQMGLADHYNQLSGEAAEFATTESQAGVLDRILGELGGAEPVVTGQQEPAPAPVAAQVQGQPQATPVGGTYTDPEGRNWVRHSDGWTRVR